MNLRFLLLIVFAAILFTSCSSVNNLKDYDLNGKKIYFDEIVGRDANTVQIYDVNSTNTTITNTNKSSTDKVLDAIGSIGTSIGKSLTESEVRQKLNRNSDPRMVLDAISSGIEKTLVQYLSITTENDVKGQYDYIVTTTLEELALKSGSGGAYISASAICTITSRKDGKIVWQQSDTETVQLRSGSINSKDSDIVKNIMQISSLASLSDDEIKNAIINAANEVGRSIANDLREDISAARK